MGSTFWRVRWLSRWAYVFLFGSLVGYATFGASAGVNPTTGTSDRGLFLVWIAGALVGSTLLALRNRRIPRRRVRGWLYLSDGLILVVLVALMQLTPAFLGLVRSAMLVAVAAAYVGVYFQLLYKGKLVPLNAPDVRTT